MLRLEELAATTTPLERELEQARNGNHPRQVAEGKRLEQMKISRLQPCACRLSTRFIVETMLLR